MFGLNLHKSGVAKCWIFAILHTKVKVKKSENAVSVHLFWLHFLAFVDGHVSVSTVVFLSS